VRFEWRRSLRHLIHYATAIAICVATIVGGWWAAQHVHTLDLSANGRHSLMPASAQTLAALPDPLIVSAYLSPKHPARPQIVDLVARYQRLRPSLQLKFIDPTTLVDQSETQRIEDGELQVSSNGRTEHVGRYNEEAFTNALLRLLQDETQFIAFVTGHGERSPLRAANFDLSHWYEVLKTRGYKVQELNLAEQRAIPDNTSLLVMASPQLEYLPGEATLVADYVARGGALLWLVEPDQPPSFDSLARTIGFERLPATVVDPVTQALGVDNPAIAIVTKYLQHPASAGVTATSLFPFATPIHERPPLGWKAMRLFETGATAWGETGRIAGDVGFDPATDYPGPLPLAVALTRQRAGEEQRVIIVGDGDFLSNTYIGNSGNQDLGTHLVDWLVINEALLKIETRFAPDVRLDLKRWQQVVIGFGFLVVLPLAFALNGIVISWRRRA
jgi:ABC-type uncharacterized transport system